MSTTVEQLSPEKRDQIEAVLRDDLETMLELKPEDALPDDLLLWCSKVMRLCNLRGKMTIPTEVLALMVQMYLSKKAPAAKGKAQT